MDHKHNLVIKNLVSFTWELEVKHARRDLLKHECDKGYSYKSVK